MHQPSITLGEPAAGNIPTKVGGFKWATFKTFAMKEDFEETARFVSQSLHLISSLASTKRARKE